MRKILLFTFISIMFVFGVSGNVLAEAIISSVKLNGSDTLTAKAGEPITATIIVNLTGSSVWKSTAYRFGDKAWSCVDTQNYSANSINEESFVIYAPTKQGNSNVEFEVYDNDNCTNNFSSASISANLSSAVMNALSLGTGEIWVLILLSGIVIIVAVTLFFIIKKIIYNKTTSNNDLQK